MKKQKSPKKPHNYGIMKVFSHYFSDKNMTHFPPTKGNIFIISAASGTGKTTLVSRLLQNDDSIHVSISHTTRQPRTGEQHGEHYYFVSKEEFIQLIGEGAFLEHAEVFGNFYGTSLQVVKEMTEQGLDVILEIDVQGAAQVRQSLPDAISIFILPPSLAILAERLRNRQTDSEESIVRRLKEAEQEIQQAYLFDYIVVNHDLDEAQAQLASIFQANRLHQKRQSATIEKVLKNI